MGVHLSPLEKFKLMKEGKPVPEEEGASPKPHLGAADVASRQHLTPVNANVSPADPDNRDEGTGTPNIKKRGEPCDHPKDRRVRGSGRLVGTIVVCLDCGSQVNDPDLAV